MFASITERITIKFAGTQVTLTVLLQATNFLSTQQVQKLKLFLHFLKGGFISGFFLFQTQNFILQRFNLIFKVNILIEGFSFFEQRF